jgi:hypothetical protein
VSAIDDEDAMDRVDHFGRIDAGVAELAKAVEAAL